MHNDTRQTEVSLEKVVSRIFYIFKHSLLSEPFCKALPFSELQFVSLRMALSPIHFFLARRVVLGMPRVYDPLRPRPCRRKETRKRRIHHGRRVYVFECPSRIHATRAVGRPCVKKQEVTTLQFPSDSRRDASPYQEIEI